jgi:hypothetical protein
MSPEDQNVVFLAEHKAMRVLHGKIRRVVRRSAADSSTTVMATSLFGVLDLAQAQSTGYRGDGTRSSSQAKEQGSQRRTRVSLDERALDIAMGDGSDREINGQTVPAGCISEARSITGDDAVRAKPSSSRPLRTACANRTEPSRARRVPFLERMHEGKRVHVRDACGRVNDPKWATSSVGRRDSSRRLGRQLQALSGPYRAESRRRFCVADEYISSHADEFKSLSRGDATKLAKARSLLATSR